MDSQTSDQSKAIREALLDQARTLGFDALGLAKPDAVPDLPERLQAFLDAGHHGCMDWLARRFDHRADPRNLWPQVRTILMLGLSYGPNQDPMDMLAHKDRGVISVYAQGGDYHDVIKKKLKRLGRWLVETHGGLVKVFVDTAPVAEKPLAQAAGLGWQGKHSNLVARDGGSWLFLGALFTTLDLPADEPETDHCGSCTRCLDICPTDAFPAPYRLDARRCISYLTIEHRGPIPHEFRTAMGNRIYGCDDCLAVCPWNKYAQRAQEAAFLPRAELTAPRLGDLARLDDAGFRQFFAGSPIKRTGRDRFIRNVLIAIGNTDDPALVPVVETLLSDDSALVRGAAIWALKQLDRGGRFETAKSRHLEGESDPQVIAEWQA